MKIDLLKDQVIEINLGNETCSLIINNRTFREKITALDVAMVGKKYDKKFKDSFIRNIYKRCLGVGANKYKMFVDYNFEV